jgi:hypothetical protein
MPVVTRHIVCGDWSYEIEPYVLFSSIEGDASIGRAVGADVDVNFDTILDNLDAGGMLHFEAHHNSGWGYVLDYGFMDLGSDVSGPRGGVVDASVRQGVFKALAVRRYQLSDSRLDYTVGVARWWDNDIDVTVDLAVLPGTLDLEVEEDWVDLVLGVRWLNNLNQDWKFLLQGDLGGFGQESGFTTSMQVGALYQLNDEWVLDLKYKATWVDYENEESKGQPGYFAYDTVTHGPLVGIIYKF